MKLLWAKDFTTHLWVVAAWLDRPVWRWPELNIFEKGFGFAVWIGRLRIMGGKMAPTEA